MMQVAYFYERNGQRHTLRDISPVLKENLDRAVLAGGDSVKELITEQLLPLDDLKTNTETIQETLSLRYLWQAILSYEAVEKSLKNVLAKNRKETRKALIRGLETSSSWPKHSADSLCNLGPAVKVVCASLSLRCK